MKKAQIILLLMTLFISSLAFAGVEIDVETNNSSPSFTGSATFTGTLGSNESAMSGTCTADVPWTLGAQWTCTGGVATKAGAGTSTLSQTTTVIEVGKWYKLAANITVTVGSTGLVPSAGGNTMAAITYTNASYVSYFYSTATTTLTFTPVSAWEGSVQSVTLQEVSSPLAVNDEYITSTNTKQPLMFQKTLNSATGNETAYYFGYETNKSAGSDSGMVINMEDTASPGTSLLLDAQVDGVSKFKVSSTGTITTQNNFNILGGQISANTNVALYLSDNPFSTGNTFSLIGATGTHSQTSGTNGALKLTPTFNQASGTASNTGILYAPTLTAVGSGTQDGIVSSLGSLAAADGVNHTWSAFKVDGTIGILDGTDIWNGLNISPTDTANHTGGTINAVNIGNITGDAQNTESAINIGTGWDYTLFSSSNLEIRTNGNAITFTSAGTTSAATSFLYNSDVTNTSTAIFRFAPGAASSELTGTSSQTFLSMATEIDMSTSTGARTLKILSIEDAAGGSYTGIPAAQAHTIQEISITKTLPILSSDDTWTGVYIAPTNADHTGGSVNGITFGSITGDAQATEVMMDVSYTGYDATFKGVVSNLVQAVTCAENGSPSTLTITPTSSYVEVTNEDAEGCNITMSETGAVTGAVVTLCIVSNAGGNVTFADTSGVTELAGAFTADINDCITLRYGNTTTWREQSRSAN